MKGTKLSNFLRGLTRYRLCRWKGGRSSPDSKEEAHVEHGGAEGMRNSGKGYLLESIHALGTSVAIFCFEVLEKRSARAVGSVVAVLGVVHPRTHFREGGVRALPL